MRRIFLASVALAAVASAACRQYDVDVYRNVNGKVPKGETHGVGQSFVCTADSLLWAEFFVGAANASGGSYALSILPIGSQTPIYTGAESSGPSVHYQYVRAELSRVSSAPLVKGETYVLKVTLSSPFQNDSLNYYYDPTNPYKYGSIQYPGLGYHPPPQPWEPDSDLCCRIEGINRPVSGEFFGVNENLEEYRNNGWPWRAVVPVFDSAGTGWWRCCRGMLIEPQPDTSPNSWNWAFSDSAIELAALHGIRTLFCFDGVSARWACTDTAHADNQYWWLWSNSPPRNLAEPVQNGSGINPDNYWGYFVYQVVNRYKPGGSFWTGARETLSDSFGIRYWEVWNEPNYMTSPQAGFGYRIGGSQPDSIAVVESLYARICDVTIEAAESADAKARVLIGGIAGVESEDLTPPGPGRYKRLVKGKDWLRVYYQNRQNDGGLGVSVHPYQESSALALSPSYYTRHIDTIRGIMRDNGDGDKPLWATELSWLAGSPDLSSLSVPGGHLLAMNGAPVNFYDRVFWASGGYNSGFLWPDSSNPGQIVWTRKPCYYAYRQMTQELVGKRMNGRVLSGDSATDAKTLVYELEDTATHKKTWVGWRNYAADPGAVSVKVPARTERLDTSYVARYQTDNQPVANVMAGPNGWFQFSLDTIPLYVREDTSATDTISRPDLAVDSIWVSFVPGSSTWPQKRRLWARVRNLGNALSGGGQALTILKFYANGDSVARAICPCLQHGETARVEGDRIWQIANGDPQMVKAVVNEDRAFVETSWDNNSKFRLFLALPVMGSQGGVNGPRTMARTSGSSPLQAVAEFTETGNPLVFYCPSLDSATSGWDSVTTGKNPSIGIGPDALPWITFTRGDTVLCSELNPASVWRTRVVFAPALGQHVGPAALTVFQGRGQWKGPSAALGQVVFPVYQNASPGSFVLHCRFDSLNASYDTLDKCSATTDRDSCVTLCSGVTDSLHCCYQKNLSVYYRTLCYDTVSTSTSSWSSAKQFGGGSVLAVHPYLGAFKDRVWLVFRQTIMSGTSIMRVSHDVAAKYNNWTNPVAVSANTMAPKDFAVLSTDEVSVWAESTAGHWHVRARVRDSVADLSDSTTNHPHILADTSVSDGPSRDRLRVRGIWAGKASGDTWLETYADRNFDRSAAAANATESNNGRKLVLQTGTGGTTQHMVYHTQAGAVYYAEAQAGSSQWTRTDLGGGDAPCIDLDYTNKRLWVAYRNDSNPGIKCQTRSTDSTTWQELTVYDCGGPTDSTEPGAPAIVGARLDPSGTGKTAAYCLFALQNHLLDSSFVILVKLNQSGAQAELPPPWFEL